MRAMALPHACVLVCFAGSAIAQPLISPRCYQLEEGNIGSRQPFFQSAGQVYQQIFGTLRGTPKVITTLSFRRDMSGLFGGAEYNWWSEFSLYFAGGAYPGATNVPANNYKTAPTQVFYNR